MKKLTLSAACALALVTTTAFAAPKLTDRFAANLKDSIGQLNTAVEKILAPYQDAHTKAEIKFANIATDAVRALSVKASGHFFKAGPSNTLNLSVNNLSYEYGDGKTPTTNLEGSLAFDLTKILPQEDLNGLIQDLETTIQDLTAEYTKAYGSAVNVVANVTEKNKDAAGNFVTAKADFAVTIDLAKLPADKKAESIPVTRANAQISLDVKKGIFVKATVVSNPGYTGFQKDQMGLKESLDLLLQQDPAALKQIDVLIQQINAFANDIVK